LLILAWLVIGVESAYIMKSWAGGTASFSPMERLVMKVGSGLGLIEPDRYGQLLRGGDRDQLKKELQQIDPYSTYLTPGEYESFSIDSRQEYQGIGVSLQPTADGVLIRQVFSGGPAEAAGLEPGDMLRQMHGFDIRNWNFAQVVEAIRGREGTAIQLSVLRGEELLDFTVSRSSIAIPSLRHAHLTDDRIFYVRIDQFGEKTATEFLQAVLPHVSTPLKGIVIDLRDNTGGMFRSSLDLLDSFFRRGEVMLKTRDTDNRTTKLHSAKRRDPLAGIPTVVLINRNTASASEIVAGSLQVTGKAVVIGERSLGKGSIQTIFSLNQGDAYKKTTSFYYLPDDTSIHERGIIPDIAIEITPASFREYRIRDQRGSPVWEDENDPFWMSALHYLREG
jgi:carboxyl-terminal processing protease